MTTYTATTPYVCGWETDDSCNKVLQTANPDLVQECVNAAAEILFALSGRQFGLCETTVRPCRTDECSPCGDSGQFGFRWTPVLEGGLWTNVACGKCKNDCSCKEVCELYLPGPINSVLEVKMDGAVVPLTGLRVDNRSSVVGMPNGVCWPLCQDMNLFDTEVGTYSVKYLRGVPLPVSGKLALAEFVVELCKACIGDATCCLPKRVTNVTRQGISMTLLDPMSFLENGKTGLYLVDAWLQSVNPKQRVRSAAVFSPDLPVTRRTTWQA